MSVAGFLSGAELTASILPGETRSVVVHLDTERFEETRTQLDNLAKSTPNVVAYSIPNPMHASVFVNCSEPVFGGIGVPLEIDTVKFCEPNLVDCG